MPVSFPNASTQKHDISDLCPAANEARTALSGLIALRDQLGELSNSVRPELSDLFYSISADLDAAIGRVRPAIDVDDAECRRAA